MPRKTDRPFRGERLKALREAAGLSQDALQRLLGFESRASVQAARWETGGREPSLGNLLKLTHLLDSNIYFLLGEIEDAAPDPTFEQSLSEDERALLNAYRRGDSLTAMQLVVKQAHQLVDDDTEIEAAVQQGSNLKPSLKRKRRV